MQFVRLPCPPTRPAAPCPVRSIISKQTGGALASPSVALLTALCYSPDSSTVALQSCSHSRKFRAFFIALCSFKGFNLEMCRLDLTGAYSVGNSEQKQIIGTVMNLYLK